MLKQYIHWHGHVVKGKPYMNDRHHEDFFVDALEARTTHGAFLSVRPM